jgi:hypothetical protein
VVSVTFPKCSRCHTNVVFSVVRVVRCDCGFVNNVVGYTFFGSGQVFLLSPVTVVSFRIL